MDRQPAVIAVIAARNGRRWIAAALESLAASTVPVRAVVVDNASSDGTADAAEKLPFVECLRLSENTGFGAATNRGIRRALEHGADYVLLLNQDARISPDMLAEMLRCCSGAPDVGIMSPLHLNYEADAVEPAFLSFVSGSCRLVSDALTGAVRELYEVPFCHAAVWLLSRALLERIGGFDPVFFMYGEDHDYCSRARFHGFKIGIAPKAVACHWHGGGDMLEKRPFQEQSLRLAGQIICRLKRPDHRFSPSLLGIMGTWAQRLLIATACGDFRQAVALAAAWLRVLPQLARIRRHHVLCRQPGMLWLGRQERACS